LRSPDASRCRELKNRGLLAWFQQRQQNDLAIRKFERVVMGPSVLLIDVPEDRGLVFDYSLIPTQRAGHAPNFVCKGQLRSW
jgi:hypothetical protein